MNAAALARLLGVSPAAIWTWEKNRAIPREATLDAISKAFGVSKEFLVTGKKINVESHDGDSIPLSLRDEQPLEQLIRAIEAKGFHVSVRLKTE